MMVGWNLNLQHVDRMEGIRPNRVKSMSSYSSTRARINVLRVPSGRAWLTKTQLFLEFHEIYIR